jgi:hypothetical protein
VGERRGEEAYQRLIIIKFIISEQTIRAEAGGRQLKKQPIDRPQITKIKSAQ